MSLRGERTIRTAVRPPYSRGEMRRLLAVLGAINRPQGARLVEIAKATGLDNKTVTLLIGQAGTQAGVTIRTDDATYRITDWGLAIRPEGARLALDGHFGT